MIIDTDVLWKTVKGPLCILGILCLIITAAFIGYCVGKNSPMISTGNISPVDDNSENLASDTLTHPAINQTTKQSINSMITFTDSDFKSKSLRLFNGGNVILEGTYTLDVIGWNSQWNNDKGWYEKGVREPTPYRGAAWQHLSEIWMNGTKTPLSLLVTGSFDYENSWGSTKITLSSPSYVGIQVNDTEYSDNRGSAIFMFSDCNSCNTISE